MLKHSNSKILYNIQNDQIYSKYIVYIDYKVKYNLVIGYDVQISYIINIVTKV